MNELVKRFNKALKVLLQKSVSKEGHDWDILLPYVLFAYRKVPQSTTGFSLFELLYSWEVQGPLNVLKEVQQQQKTWYYQTAREREMELGEEVLVLLPTSSNKLLAQW